MDNWIDNVERRISHVLEQYPDHADKLKRIRTLEREIERKLKRKRRLAYALNAEPPVRQKILRVYVNHEYRRVRKSDVTGQHDRNHFVLTIEGQILDSKYQHTTFFSEFFSKIEVQLDRKIQPVNHFFEWHADDAERDSARVHAFRFKIHADKSCPSRITMYRKNTCGKRFSTSAALAELFPSLPADPTEDEVYLAVWDYIQSHELIDQRDRKVVHADEALKEVFGVDQFSVTQIAQLVHMQLEPMRPLQFDYVLGVGESKKAGPRGKTFDIEVDVEDVVSHEIIDCINQDAAASSATHLLAQRFQRQSLFFSKRIIEQFEHVQKHERIAELGAGAVEFNALEKENQREELARLANPHEYETVAEMQQCSVLDVGDAALFAHLLAVAKLQPDKTNTDAAEAKTSSNGQEQS